MYAFFCKKTKTKGEVTMFGRVSKENGEIKENLIYLDGTGVLERISREVGVNNFRQKLCTIGHRS